MAEDGLEALDILKTFFPDIIFSDLIMPNIDGRKLCRSIREMQQHAACWIAVMSALAAEESINPVELGADFVIAKVPLEELGRIIVSVVENPEKYRQKCRMGQVLGLEDIWPRQITQELLTAKRHVEIILEKMKEGILEIEANGRILSVNAQVRSLTRLSEGDLLGAKLIALFPPEQRHRVEVLLAERGRKEINEEDPVPFHGHLVTLSIIPLKDHAVVIINDITERKRKERELKESQDRFRFLVDNMLDAAVIVDPKGKTFFANKAAAELVGIGSLEEGIGMNVDHFIHPDYRKAVMRNYLLARKDRKTFLDEYKIVTPEGEEKDVEGHGTTITFKGMPAYIATLRGHYPTKKGRKANQGRHYPIEQESGRNRYFPGIGI